MGKKFGVLKMKVDFQVDYDGCASCSIIWLNYMFTQETSYSIFLFTMGNLHSLFVSSLSNFFLKNIGMG